MKKMLMISMIVAFVALVALGCDSRKAKIQKNIEKYKLTQEQAQQQEANRQVVLKSLEQYKQDFGVYPRTLDELKQQGYQVSEPLEGWEWQYQVDNTGRPQVTGVPK